MDGRALELSHLPPEIFCDDLFQHLTLESLLKMRQVCQNFQDIVDVFIQYQLPKIPLQQILNHDDNHFIYICNLIKKNPALMQPLSDPDKLLAFFLQLKPIGLLRLSIIFADFYDKLYEPMRLIANSFEEKWFIAFICCAVITPDITTLDMNALVQAIWWLNSPQHNNMYAAIIVCLTAIERVRRMAQARLYIDAGDLPDASGYLNLQGGDFSNAKLRRIKLPFANLARANLMSAELTGAKLHGAYFKDANFRDGHLWGAFFFDLQDNKTTLLTQLDLLDSQLPVTETSYRLDEALAEDLIAQISALKAPPSEKSKTLQLALNHRFFTSRLENTNINVAFIKTLKTIGQPSTTGFFQLPRLNSAFRLRPAPSSETSPKPPK